MEWGVGMRDHTLGSQKAIKHNLAWVDVTLPAKGAGIVPDEWSTGLTSLSLLSEPEQAVFIQSAFSPY